MEFKFFMPTKVFMGKNCVNDNSEQLKGLGKKALIVTGQKSAVVTGALEDMKKALDRESVEFLLFDKVEANPSLETVMSAAKMARKEKVDFVIGIGGGSSIDVAKAVAVLIYNELEEEQLFAGIYSNPVVPIVAIPTTAGTGSEATPYSIITDNKKETKMNLATEKIFPQLSFLDATYTKTLSSAVTVDTAIDAFSHAAEGFVAKRATAITEMLSLESIRIIGKLLPFLKGDFSLSFVQREKLLYASFLAGIVIAHTGTTAVHSLGYPLTYFLNIPHGRANGFIMPPFFDFLQTAENVKVDILIQALGLNNLFEFRSLMVDLIGNEKLLQEDDITKFAHQAVGARNMLNTTPQPTVKELEDILRASLCF